MIGFNNSNNEVLKNKMFGFGLYNRNDKNKSSNMCVTLVFSGIYVCVWIIVM